MWKASSILPHCRATARGPLGLLFEAFDRATALVVLSAKGTGTSTENAARIERIVKIEGRWEGPFGGSYKSWTSRMLDNTSHQPTTGGRPLITLGAASAALPFFPRLTLGRWHPGHGWVSGIALQHLPAPPNCPPS